VEPVAGPGAEAAADPADPADPVWDRLPAADPAAAFDEGEYRAALTERALTAVRPEFSPAVWGLFEATVLGSATPAAAAARAGVSANAVYLARSRVLRRLREVLTGLLD
jgi:RNA polymerase sigma-70 factor (ECF subfamily)